MFLFSIAKKKKLCYIDLLRSRGKAVNTPPFHGGIVGSNPAGITKKQSVTVTQGGI